MHRRVGDAAALLVLAIAVCVLVGWATRLTSLRGIDPSNPIRANTALALAAWALALLAVRARNRGPWRAVAAMVGGLVALLGAATLLEWITGRALGIDHLLVGSQTGPGVAPGRPAPQAALGLVFLGVALAVQVPASRRGRSVRDLSAGLAGATGMFALLGHLTHSQALFTIGGTYPLPSPAAVAIMLAAFAVLFTLPPGETAASRFAEETPGGAVLRWTFPAAILLPATAQLVEVAARLAGVGKTTTDWTVTTGLALAAVVAVWQVTKLLDTTEQRRRAHERRYRDLFDGMSDGVFETDADGRFVLVNPALAHMLGFVDPAAMVATVGSADALIASARQRAMVEADATTIRNPLVIETAVLSASGASVWVRATVSPVLDPSGTLTAFRGTVADITPAVQAAAVLAEARSQLEIAFETGPHGRILLDLHGDEPVMARINHSVTDLLGFAPDELVGQAPWMLAHPDDVPGLAAGVSRLLAGAVADLSTDSRAKRADGSWMPARLTTAIARDAAGRPIYGLVTIEDISERQQAEEGRARDLALLHQRAQTERALAQLATMLLGSPEASATMDDAAELVRNALALDQVAFLRTNGADLAMVAGAGWHDGALPAHRRLVASPGSLSAATLEGATVVVEDWESEPRFRQSPVLESNGVRTSIAVPIQSGGRCYGVISAHSRERRDVPALDVLFLESVASLFALALRDDESRAKLRRSTQTLTSLVDNAPAAIHLADADGRLILVNREFERVHEVRRQDVLGQPCEAVTPRAGDDCEEEHLDIMASGAPVRLEEAAEQADGVHTYRTVKFPLLDDGVPYGVGGISTDITDLVRADEEREEAWRQAVHRIGRAVEYRDEETGAHIERMSAYSELIARHLHLPEEQCQMIRAAAPMHDAGKVAIPDSILLKPGPLTTEERAVMQTHSEIGYRLLTGSGSPLLELAATIAWTHHERFDGTGYPRRLAGSEIPLEGRIAAVADVFDALTSDRSYRLGLSVDEAVAIMRAQRGLHFDPPVLDAFLDHLDEAVGIAEAWNADSVITEAASA